MTIRRRFIQLVFDIYVVFVLVLSTDAFVSLLVGAPDLAHISDGSPVTKVAWGLIYAITCLRIFEQRHLVGRLIRANRPLVLLILLTLVSALWSVDLGATFHGAVILIFSSAFAIDLSIRYPLSRLIQLTCIALVLVVGLSVFVELFLPGFVPSTGGEVEATAWHGVFGTKNEFGRMVVLAVVACLALPRQPRWNRAFAVAAGFLLGLLARSAGAMVYLSASIAIFMSWSILRWRPIPRKITIFAVAIVAVLMIAYASQNLADVTTMIGRDPTLTGRVDLWRLSVENISERPMLGYGYGAFWTISSQEAIRLRQVMHWEAPHAHNGYIDITLGLGLVGLAIFLVGYGVIARRAYLFFKRNEGNEGKWALTFLAFVVLYQFTEGGMVTGNWILWILYVATAFSLSRAQEAWQVSAATSSERLTQEEAILVPRHG